VKILATFATVFSLVAVSLMGTPSPAVAEGLNPVPCIIQPLTRDNPNFTAREGAKAYFGDYEGGMYRFEVPDKWNGELALIMHGLNASTNMSFGNPSNPFTGTPGLREYMIDNGFAWGASTYRCNGSVPGIGLSDTILLKDLFVKLTGKAPGRTYLLGNSLGGFQTELALHVYPEMFDGALAMCALNHGLWEYGVAAGAAAEYITGLRFTSPATIAQTQRQMVAMTGLPGSLTQKGLQLASVQINIGGGPRPFAMEGLSALFTGIPTFQANMNGAALSAGTAAANLTRGNPNTKYSVDPGLGITAQELDANVRRLTPNPAFYEAHEETRPLSGKIKRPLLTLHTTGDMIVPVLTVQTLQRVVEAAGNADLLVQRYIRAPGHCTFSGPEQAQAFEDLVKWVRLGIRPEGDNVFGDLSDAGRKFTNPMRPGDPGTIRPPTTPQAQ
jgi:pimeloyl-ACP methyl ester carboxylesterase